MNRFEEYIRSVIPGAQLSWQAFEFLSGTELYLLSPESTHVDLETEDIGKLWQGLPYWAFSWAAGTALAQFILENPEKVAGKTVLDFGCGSGVTGIAAARSGAEKVLCCDLDPLACEAAVLNGERNGVNISSVTDWQSCDVDCLLAADVLYDLSSAPDMAELCMDIPQWLLAETGFQKPAWAWLRESGKISASTWPRLDDFDEQITVTVFERDNA